MSEPNLISIASKMQLITKRVENERIKKHDDVKLVRIKHNSMCYCCGLTPAMMQLVPQWN